CRFLHELFVFLDNRIFLKLLKKYKRQEMFSSIRLVFYTKYTSGIFNADTRFLFTAKGSINMTCLLHYIYNTQNIHVNKHTIYTDFLHLCQVVDFQQSTIRKNTRHLF
ncbi:MAG: hypothetical protein DBY24_08055, partial [Prevotellaceae bacterium]